ARQWVGSALTEGLTPVTVLPLPPVYPYDQRGYAADDGAFHLLWLDRDPEAQVTRLYGALIAPDLSIIRTVPISPGLALRYAAASDGDGGLLAAWSGDQLSELALNVRHLDREGRPLDVTSIAAQGEYPALVTTNGGNIFLFWISGGQVIRTRLDAGSPVEYESITSAVSLAVGDRLVDFSAALDTTYAYLFWNITRADGTPETWFTAGRLDAPYWNAPARLSISVTDDRVETGFRATPRRADAGTTPLRWASPATGQFDTLAVAVESPEGVGVIYLRGGAITGYQTVVPNVYLIGAPALVVRADLSLTLAWSSPDAPRAHLNLLPVP
ncbi:MAG: hypothetical protein IAE80_06845, partial [Anaerolinea sp.]|nr:hypothetical protein [Anaerolinea sp.]